MSPLFLFTHVSDVKQMSDRRHEHSNERNANKHDCLMHSIQKNPSTMVEMSDDHLAITLTNFTNICWLNNGNTRPPALCAREVPDEKL